MAAPKGHKFWMLRAKSGYDPKYTDPDELWARACEYFNWIEAHPLIEVEQVKSPAKPYKDEEGEWVAAPTTVQLPKMRPFTMGGLFLYLGVNHSYFSDAKDRLRKSLENPRRKAADKENDRRMLYTIERITQTIYVQKFEGAAAGLLNAGIIVRDLGLVDKQESHTDGKQTITVRYANRNNTTEATPGPAGSIE